MTREVPQHRHCDVCGKAVPPDVEVCGEACREDREARRRKRRIYTYLFYGATIVAVAGLFGPRLF